MGGLRHHLSIGYNGAVSVGNDASTSAVLILASVLQIELLAEEKKETFQLRKELTCITNLLRSREGGHPQGWKAQTRRQKADEMAW